MAVREVAALTGTIIRIASAIQNIGNEWYKASNEWDDFPRKVGLLSIKHKIWLAKFAKFGMLSDSDAKPLIDALGTAELLLKAEEDDLTKKREKGKRSSVTRLLAKSSMVMFPAKLGLSIRTVIDAFDDILDLLKYEEEAEATLEKREQRMAFPLPFHKDPRYVPLKATEKAIRDALVSHAVVLLHGGPGKGKSTLARAIALEYKEEAALFEDVFYLECGPGSASTWSSAVQFKLLQHLGVALNLEEEAGPGSDFPKRLQSHLKDRKLLIILDDVWHEGLLRGMVNLCGSGIKCLVTSQRKDLCQGLTCSSIHIPIEDVQLQDARKILAIHVGFSDHFIPRHLEEIADQVIQEIERNPLALAIVGGSIDTRRSNELDVWEVVANDLFVKLDAHSTTCMNNMEYPRNLWATMKRSFESLEKGAQFLLILVGMCDGLSVPEEVIQLLYGSIRAPGVSTDFAKLRQDLENREMVKITTVSDLEVPRKERSWSIHSLQKKFIEGVVKDARESVFALLKGLSFTETRSPLESVFALLRGLYYPLKSVFTLLKGLYYPLRPQIVKGFSVDDEDILICLAALYFDKQLKQRAVKRAMLKMGIPSHKFSNLRRSAIEPVIRLLGQPISKRWTKQLCTSTKRVFMGYICSDTLKDNDISDLLASPISRLAMMNSLGDIATLGETTLLDEKLHYYMDVLIDLVENGYDGEGNTNNVQKATHKALAYLCKNKVCCTFIATKLSRVLDTIMRWLLTDGYPEFVRRWAAYSLRQLCQAEEGNVPERIVQYPGFLELLSTENNPILRLNGSYVKLVFCLAHRHNDIKLKLVSTGVLLEEYVKLLFKDDDVKLQRDVVAVLANLAAGVGEVKVKMLEKFHEIPGAMDGLSRLLAEHIDPKIQYWAVGALTLIYPTEGNKVHLYSREAYEGRGYANLLSGNYKASLADLDKALEGHPKDADILSLRRFVLAKLGDYQGALLDANKVLEIQWTPFRLQERGILKRMMGDLHGALEDLDKGLEIETNHYERLKHSTMGDLPGALEDLDKGLEIETNHYERLKHRGFVKFLMNDKVGASADAEWALRIKPPRVDDPRYGRSCLGTSSIEYMGYTLR